MKWGDILVNKKKAQKKRGKVLYVYHALKYLFLIRRRVICQEVICLSLWFHHISSVFTLFSMHEDPSSLQPHYFSLHLIQDALNGAFLKMTDTRRLWTSIKQMDVFGQADLRRSVCTVRKLSTCTALSPV